nr:MAG TPA: hypothetical protein [Caudoviricetes sp.]
MVFFLLCLEVIYYSPHISTPWIRLGYHIPPDLPRLYILHIYAFSMHIYKISDNYLNCQLYTSRSKVQKFTRVNSKIFH